MLSTVSSDVEPLYRFFKLFTHLGDSALLLPFSIIVISLLLYQNYPMGLRLAFVILADLVLTFLLKICFYAFGGSTEFNILSPSGHASFSIAVYGCCAVVLANKRCLAKRVLIVGTTVVLVLTITVSRIILHAHTSEEAVVGSLVGGICVAVFSTGGSRLQKFQLRLPIWVLVVLMIGTVSAWAVGHQIHTERLIEHWGIKIGSVWDES